MDFLFLTVEQIIKLEQASRRQKNYYRVIKNVSRKG